MLLKSLIIYLFISISLAEDCIDCNSKGTFSLFAATSVEKLNQITDPFLSDKFARNDKLDPIYTRRLARNGILIAGSTGVDCPALLRASSIVDTMLGNNPDLALRLHAGKASINIFKEPQRITDLPEYAHLKGATTGNGAQNVVAGDRSREELCGMGGQPRAAATGICYSNLMKTPDDKYHGKENILMHEFAHTIMNVGFTAAQKRNWEVIFNEVKAKNIFRTPAGGDTYEMNDSMEYFAVLSTVWFNTPGSRNYDGTNPIHSNLLSDQNSIKNNPDLARTFEFLRSIYPEGKNKIQRPDPVCN